MYSWMAPPSVLASVFHLSSSAIQKKIHSSTTYRFVFFFAWSDLKKKVIQHSCHRADEKKIRQIIGQIIYTYYTLI